MREGSDLNNGSSRMVMKFKDISGQDAQGKQQSWPDLDFTDLRKGCSREIGPRVQCPAATVHKDDPPRTDYRCADIIEKVNNCRIGEAANPGPGDGNK
eukprot:5829200-Heterocapsa_arctica.AAC.1